MSYIHDTKFGVGQTVWHIVSCKKGMVVSINIRPSGISYEVIWSDMSDGYHYEIELTDQNLTPQQLMTE